MNEVNYNDPPRLDLPAAIMIGCLLGCAFLVGGYLVLRWVAGPYLEVIF